MLAIFIQPALQDCEEKVDLFQGEVKKVIFNITKQALKKNYMCFD